MVMFAKLFRRHVIAISALLSAIPAFAQGGDAIPQFDATPYVVVLSILISIGLIIYVFYSARKTKDEEIVDTDLPKRQDSAILSLKVRGDDPPQSSPIEKTSQPEPQPPPKAAEVIVPAPQLPKTPANRSIFISYRRQDSQHITGRIYDRLSQQFGRETVFKDVDSIPLGFDFRDHIREQVTRCSVFVVVIGRGWKGPNGSGAYRINDPRDYLRIEIESALERRIPVIPVLVDNVEMPSDEDLPPSLAQLAYHHGISIRPDPDFHADADRLIRGIDSLFK
jgi:TIR domain-containing protein